MAKTTSSLVLSIIFLMMFSLVEENMGCLAILDDCDLINCGATCKSRFGPTTNSLCLPDGGIRRCVCVYPCPNDKTHI
ncbi:hypothetical protein EUTSA_v10027161mg [Eutrema salsugineum]|uniref:Defensin-like protein n=1 Tax=Eutrema salsugineum TaxID=72664 RepID=V4MG23_EUTSA|nr:hypothetical protein EUTSA_v10027161mg [Eutrema salsugineum]